MNFAIAALLGLVAVQAVTIGDYFTPHDHEAHYYERVTTPRFSQDGDDIFMRSMIEQYALEEKTKVVEHDDGTKTGGEPTGKFWMDFNTSKAAASEVLGTHKGLHGAALQTYLDTYYEKAWRHFDVNQSGAVEVIKMP
jgi:hypothetical protein|tara:strand:+ start:110 stop:523 length:414 start_codon:yes stop_codon:yes gene_type:complete